MLTEAFCSDLFDLGQRQPIADPENRMDEQRAHGGPEQPTELNPRAAAVDHEDVDDRHVEERPDLPDRGPDVTAAPDSPEQSGEDEEVEHQDRPEKLSAHECLAAGGHVPQGPEGETAEQHHLQRRDRQRVVCVEDRFLAREILDHRIPLGGGAIGNQRDEHRDVQCEQRLGRVQGEHHHEHEKRQ